MKVAADVALQNQWMAALPEAGAKTLAEALAEALAVAVEPISRFSVKVIGIVVNAAISSSRGMQCAAAVVPRLQAAVEVAVQAWAVVWVVKEEAQPCDLGIGIVQVVEICSLLETRLAGVAALHVQLEEAEAKGEESNQSLVIGTVPVAATSSLLATQHAVCVGHRRRRNHSEGTCSG